MAGEAFHGVRDAVLRAFADGGVQGREDPGPFRRDAASREVVGQLARGYRAVADRPAGETGDRRRHLVVGQGLGAGDDQVVFGGGRGGEGVGAHRRDVVGVDEGDAARAGRGRQGAVGADSCGVGPVVGEVLHEPGGAEHRPLLEQGLVGE
ncbi:putative oxidoreductase YesF [Streptomyces aurantiacus JA 4570]|uniref:Putative oxidoreductase YesF n=1 Tax=Streptomyces aurantiacus JA 4570 TaxID=1286094 RepID=S3ZSB0_9ACTN|nr:putative oxidoreductase YesF [Streptomyces aurantiacus JA 4570]